MTEATEEPETQEPDAADDAGELRRYLLSAPAAMECELDEERGRE